MKYLLYLIPIFVVLNFTSCYDKEKEQDREESCSNLVNGIQEMNDIPIKLEISKQTFDLVPKVTDEDPIGHMENMHKLVNRLNDLCNEIEAELICYACIETYPSQSEIKITAHSEEEDVSLVIDILLPEDDLPVYHSMHEF